MTLIRTVYRGFMVGCMVSYRPTDSSQSDTLQVKSTSTPKEILPYFNSPLTLSHSVSHSLQRNDYENHHQSTQNLPNQL